MTVNEEPATVKFSLSDPAFPLAPAETVTEPFPDPFGGVMLAKPEPATLQVQLEADAVTLIVALPPLEGKERLLP